MKKLALLGILIVGLAAAAPAQTTRPFGIYVGGGIGFPISPDEFKDLHDMGFHGKIGVSYRFPSAPGFELMGKFEYHTFGASDENLADSDFRPLLFGADAKYAFGLPTAPTKPYVLGGLGLAAWEFTDGDDDELIDEELDGSDLYLNFGAGVDLTPGEAFGVFIEGRYVMLLTEGDATTFVPITAGFKF
jgi:hypothetical protein